MCLHPPSFPPRGSLLWHVFSFFAGFCHALSSYLLFSWRCSVISLFPMVTCYDLPLFYVPFHVKKIRHAIYLHLPALKKLCPPSHLICHSWLAYFYAARREFLQRRLAMPRYPLSNATRSFATF